MTFFRFISLFLLMALTACDKASVPSDTAPNLSLMVSAPSVADAGDTVDLSAMVSINGTDINSGVTYVWEDKSAQQLGLTSNNDTASFVALAGIDEAIILVTASFGGSSVSETINIVINQPPKLTITAPSAVDVGTSVDISALLSIDGVDVNSGVIYVWEDKSTQQVGLTSNSDTANFVAISGIDEAVILVTASYDGVTVSKTTSITINPPPNLSLTVTAPLSVDVGDNVNLSAMVSADGVDVNSGVTYVWEDKSTQQIGLASSDDTANFVAIAGIHEAVILVTASFEGVTVSRTVSITVNPPASSNLAIGITAPAHVDVGSSVSLSAMLSVDGVDVNSGVTYTWEDKSTQPLGLTSSNDTANFVAIAGIHEAVILVTATYNGATVSKTTSIKINPAPNLTLTVTAPSPVDAGTSVDLVAMVSADGADVNSGVTYVWEDKSTQPVVLSSKDNTANFVAISGVHEVVILVTAKYKGATVSKTTSITINPPPHLDLTLTAPSIVDVGDSVDLSAMVSINGTDVTTGVTYVWEDKSAQSIALASKDNTAHFVAVAGIDEPIVLVTASYKGATVSEKVSIAVLSSVQPVEIGALDISGPTKVKSAANVILNALYTETSTVKPNATFAWTQDEGPDVGFNANNGELSFTAPDVLKETELAFSAQTTNDDGELFDTLWFVTVTPPDIGFSNQLNTGQSQVGSQQQTAHTIKQATSGDTVHLTTQAQQTGGGGSFTYAWTQLQVTGTPVVITHTDTSKPTATFVAPSAAGKLTFSVTATESNSGRSISQTHIVNILGKPFIPQQGAQHEVYNGHGVISLKGRVQGGTAPFTYAWSQTSGPTAPITSLTAENPDVTPPTVTTDTDFTWEVKVTDANGQQVTSTHIVTVKAVPKLAVSILHPASADVAEGDTVLPQAQISGGTGNYSIRWTSSVVTLIDETTAAPSFVVPTVSKDTNIVVNLAVSDGTNQITQSVRYTAKPLFTVNSHQNQSGSNLATGPNQSTHQNNQIESGNTFKPSVDVHENAASGGTFTYAWTVVKPNPAPADLVIAGANTAQPVVSAPSVTSTTPVELQAVVTYSVNGKSVSKTVNSVYQVVPYASPSKPPMSLSMAGHESVYSGRLVNPTVSVMNAAGTITYKWTVVSGPTIAGGITDDTTDHPSFTVPVVTGHQDLVIEVEVSDGSSVKTAQVTFAIDPFFVPTKLPLTVVAANDATVVANTTVTPRASVTNSNGTPTYAWAQTSGPTITLTGANTATPSFTAPAASGTVVVEVTVTDNDNSPVTDTITYQIQNGIKVTGGAASRSVAEGNTLDLLASVQDAAGSVTYAWTVVDANGLTLPAITDADKAAASLVLPAVSADTDIKLQVTATDSANTSTAATTITISDRHMRVDAGADYGVPLTMPGYLHGNAQGGLPPYTYLWTPGPFAAALSPLSSTSSANPSFTAPAIAQKVDFKYTLEVTDSLGNKGSDVVNIHTLVPEYEVDAGQNFPIIENAWGSLFAKAKNNLGVVAWKWVQISGDDVSSTFTSYTDANPWFQAPAATPGQFKELVFEVSGTDASSTLVKKDQVKVLVQSVPDIYVDVDAMQVVKAGEEVSLVGSVSGPGTLIETRWRPDASNSHSIGTLSPATNTKGDLVHIAKFFAPVVTSDTTLRFNFAAEGTGNLATAQQVVVVRANPATVETGPDRNVVVGETVQLTGLAAGTVTYSWVQELGKNVVLSDANSQSPSFVVPPEAILTTDKQLRFRVTATGATTTSDTVTLKVFQPNIEISAAGDNVEFEEGDVSTNPITHKIIYVDKVTSGLILPADVQITVSPISAAGNFSIASCCLHDLEIDPTGLAAGTYTVDLAATSATHNENDGVRRFYVTVTKPLPPATPPMPKTIDLSANTGLKGIAGVAGNHSLHAPTITGGLPPYTYTWGLGKDANGLIVTGGTTDNPTVAFPAVPSTCTAISGKISLTVTDANGDTATGDVAYSSTPALNPISPVSCHTCRGPKFICERSHAATVCDVSLSSHKAGTVNSDLQYCINDIENLTDGSRYVTRRCATAEEVNHDWFTNRAKGSTVDRAPSNAQLGHLGRRDGVAYKYNVTDLQDAHFTISAACKGDNCNLETMPDDTLGLLPSYRGTPQYDPNFPNGKIDQTINSVPPTPKPGVCP